MEFVDLLSAKENTFLKDLRTCMTSGYKTYVYGGGEVAERLVQIVEPYGIRFEGKLVNGEYLRPGGDEICLEVFFASLEGKINVVVAFSKYTNQLSAYAEKVNMLIDYDSSSAKMWGLEGNIKELLVTYIDRIERVYNCLQDDVSRQSLVAFMNQKISLQRGYLSKVKSYNEQYFEHDIVKLTNDEVFIDCGAYDGDTAKDFIDVLHDQGIDSYEHIISFEPEEKNYELLKKRGFKNHLCVKKGVSDKPGVVHFASAGTSSKIDCDGENSIEIDTIDNVLDGDKATFIKMDIEGAELAALKGAKQTIQKYKPTLAICIYHKMEDLWEIPEYIHSLVPEYKFYVRAYRDHTMELVLYAVV